MISNDNFGFVARVNLILFAKYASGAERIRVPDEVSEL